MSWSNDIYYDPNTGEYNQEERDVYEDEGAADFLSDDSDASTDDEERNWSDDEEGGRRKVRVIKEYVDGSDDSESEDELEMFRERLNIVEPKARVVRGHTGRDYLDKFSLTRLISERTKDLIANMPSILGVETLINVIKKYSGRVPIIEIEIAKEEFRQVLETRGKQLDYLPILRDIAGNSYEIWKPSDFSNHDPIPLLITKV